MRDFGQVVGAAMAVALAATGCGGGDGLPDGGDASRPFDAAPRDARATLPDAGRPDASGHRDASEDASAAPPDAAPDAGPACPANRQPPTGTVRATSCLLYSPETDCTSYSAVFGGFPGTTGIRRIVVAQDEYIALELTPRSIPPEARANINVEGIQGGVGVIGGRLIWSISRCPGDFDVDAIASELDPACVEVGTANFGFGGSAHVADPERCALTLEPGSTYYLNILYSTDDPNDTPSTELEWACGFFGDTECGHQYQVSSPAGWE
jgi:hypothetical protein